ncbi:MAG: MmgE/PrpD family protein [Candidatus Micrarchaeales archaeon]|jgi:2-methylcitrate dehydratase|uniref:2-methylcitrate dehydratase n=1 Tax=Candidatus Micrarchaeum acidiphilum ARMAN-2 TaxID=425595 RepID=C7DI75_MICA2|nr:MAG: 2-methylcitrate dehydratase [Candidatus Micrarchaeum acidiphilum ARMAN-2]MCW6160898.1 MmgE/PrpD family protein [Candidatus Micrarchaeales archaeon]
MELAEKLFEYSQHIRKTKIGSWSEDVKMRIADYIFVAYSARNAPPVKIAKKVLLPSIGKHNSHIYFTNELAPVEASIFINGTMGRYQDYNDTYLSKEAMHPSDNITAVLAIADYLGSKGVEIIKAVYLAYQIACSFADAFSIRARGWDHVNYISISSAAAMSYLLGLNRQQFVNAISLAINNNISMRQTRAGRLSMWKACTVGYAMRDSAFATLMAKSGLTGPSPIFEGEMGFFNQISGKLSPNLYPDKIKKTMIKEFPVEYHATSAVEAALSLRNKISGEILSIDIDTYKAAYEIITKGPEKLRPANKETADHSLPYIVAYTLLYGAPTTNSYSINFLKDKKILSLIDMTSVRVSKDFDKLYPRLTPVKITVKIKNHVFSETVKVQKGSPIKPFKWDDILTKGTAIIGSKTKAEKIISLVKSLEKNQAKDIFELIKNVDTKR